MNSTKTFSWQALLSLCLMGGMAAGQMKITLPRQDGQGDFEALAFPLTRDLSVSIGVVGAEVQKLSAGKAGEKAPEIVAHDPESRLLLLKTNAEDAELPEMGEAISLLPGDALYTKTGKGGELCRVVSWVSSFDQEPLPFAFLRVAFAGEVAEAGQPLYDADGKLAAIAHQPTPGKGNSCYAVPVEALKRVLGDVDRGQPIRRCWVGCLLDAPNTYPKIVGIRPESPAAKAGLQKGDVLLKIGSRRMRNYDDVVNAFYYLLAGKNVVFQVLRGVEVVGVKVTPIADPRYSIGES